LIKISKGIKAAEYEAMNGSGLGRTTELTAPMAPTIIIGVLKGRQLDDALPGRAADQQQD
jgi:hypothetical protein